MCVLQARSVSGLTKQTLPAKTMPCCTANDNTHLQLAHPHLELSVPLSSLEKTELKKIIKTA